MGRRGNEIGLDVKNVIVELLQSGYSRRKISEMLKLPKSTVIDVCKKFSESGSVENKPRSGRPPKIKPRDYRQLERIVKTNRRCSLSDITAKFNEERQNPVSKRTVQHNLHKNNYRRSVAKKKLVIKEVNRKKRLAWCRGKRQWTVDNWKRVIFSDESKIMIGHDERVRIWRKRDEGWRPDLVQSTTPRAKYDVMIWGCICWEGVGTVTPVEGNITASKYQDILEDNLWPVLARHFPQNGYYFQDDNAPVHRARSTQEYVARNHINCLSWPAQSPDLNIIENVWLYIKRKLQTRTGWIHSRADLIEEIRRIWTTITPAYIQSLYRCIPRRIQHAIRLKGHLTKY
jgi:transposase